MVPLDNLKKLILMSAQKNQFYNYCTKMTEENTKRRRQLFIQLTSKFKKKVPNINYKSQPSELSAKQLAKNKDTIMRTTFSQMTKWKTRQSAPHVNQHPHHQTHDHFYKTQPTPMTSIKNIEPSQSPIIHDTFTHRASRKNKEFQIAQVQFRKKDKKNKHGLVQLANHIATPKLLGSKDKTENQKNAEKKMRLRSYKKYRDNKIQCRDSQFFQNEFNLTKRGASSNSQWTSQRSSSLLRQNQSKQKWAQRLNPWYQNQECMPFRNALIRPAYGLSDIILE